MNPTKQTARIFVLASLFAANSWMAVELAPFGFLKSSFVFAAGLFTVVDATEYAEVRQRSRGKRSWNT